MMSSSTSNPKPRLSEIAGQHDLGAFVARYPAFKEAIKTSIWYCLGGLGMVGYAVFGIVAGFELEMWILALVFVLGLLLTAYGAVSIAKLLSQEIQTHEKGFVYQRLGGVDVVPYQDLLGVLVDVTKSRHVQSGTTYHHGKIVAQLRSQRITINPDVESVESFASEFVNEAGQYVIANVLGELRQGRSVSCGSLVLTPQGVEANGQVLPFSSKLRAWVDSSHVAVRAKKDQEVKFKKSRVLNTPYLEAVIRAMDPSRPQQVVIPSS